MSVRHYYYFHFFWSIRVLNVMVNIGPASLCPSLHTLGSIHGAETNPTPVDPCVVTTAQTKNKTTFNRVSGPNSGLYHRFDSTFLFYIVFKLSPVYILGHVSNFHFHLFLVLRTYNCLICFVVPTLSSQCRCLPALLNGATVHYVTLHACTFTSHDRLLVVESSDIAHVFSRGFRLAGYFYFASLGCGCFGFHLPGIWDTKHFQFSALLPSWEYFFCRCAPSVEM